MKAKLVRADANPLRHEESLCCLPMMVGRRLDCGIHVDSPWASGCHCEIDQIEGTLVVRDLDSRNGPFVNGSRVIESLLIPGDQMAIAKEIWRRLGLGTDIVEVARTRALFWSIRPARPAGHFGMPRTPW